MTEVSNSFTRMNDKINAIVSKHAVQRLSQRMGHNKKQFYDMYRYPPIIKLNWDPMGHGYDGARKLRIGTHGTIVVKKITKLERARHPEWGDIEYLALTAYWKPKTEGWNPNYSGRFK